MEHFSNSICTKKMTEVQIGNFGRWKNGKNFQRKGGVKIEKSEETEGKWWKDEMWWQEKGERVYRKSKNEKNKDAQ